MTRYTQESRPMRVDGPLETDVLLLQGFRGVEAVSRPYLFTVDLLSEDPEVAAEDLLRKPMVLTVQTPGGEPRYVHGIVRSFTELHRQEDLTHYRAEVVPWLWFLSLTSECRIFQGLSVLEIIEKVFDDLGYSDFDFRCTRYYQPREYCVQYRETSLDFVSRLMEEEGVFYFFEHSSSKHVLVIADNNTAFKPCPSQDAARMVPEPLPDEDVVTSLERRHAVHVGSVSLQDYDPLQPSLTLATQATGDEGEEVYDYPGKYTKVEAGDRYARIRLEQRELHGRIVRGASTCRGFQTGYAFDLSEHHRADANGPYLLTEIRHAAGAGDYRTWDHTALDYENEFVALPQAVPYRPPMVTPRPSIRGTQPAIVVGPAGEEVYVDKHGRIKVQFYWDREGQGDENSSCWIRVATPWAGKGWGQISWPRIGNEVVVGFEEGDPDRPLVVGSVYNAEQVPPFALPRNHVQMGMKTRSSLGGGGYNEITLIDTKGEELINIHGQKDRRIVIENDDTESVGNDQSVNVGNDRSESVGADETISVGGNRSESVGKNETISVGGNRSRSVGGNEDVRVDKKRSTEVGSDDVLKVGKKRSAQVGDDDELKVGKKLAVMAGDEILLKTGKATIQMKKDGTILIKGKDVKVQASGKISVKASSTITLKGSQIKEN